MDPVLSLAAHALHVMGKRCSSREIASYLLSAEGISMRNRARLADPEAQDEYELAARLTKTLKRHGEEAAARRRIVVRGPGNSWELGPHAIAVLPRIAPDLKKPSDTQFTGLAGEYAVMSELSACDWNVAKFAYDDGVDIVAIKGTQMRTVQVKTAHKQTNQTFQYTIRREAHRQHQGLHHYYVLVMRTMQVDRYLNEFWILNDQQMAQLQVHGTLSPAGEEYWKLIVNAAGGTIKVGDADYSNRLNRFATLFV